LYKYTWKNFGVPVATDEISSMLEDAHVLIEYAVPTAEAPVQKKIRVKLKQNYSRIRTINTKYRAGSKPSELPLPPEMRMRV